jgi:predicted ester cyclase
MGVAREAAEGVISALEDYDVNRARAWLADNFTFYDPFGRGEPMSADEWLGANASLFQAFPDFRFNFDIVEEEGDQVWVSTFMEGTHTGDWDLSFMGVGVVPATGRTVSTGESVTLGIVNDEGKIESFEVVEQGEDAGMGAVLQQLGIEMG